MSLDQQIDQGEAAVAEMSSAIRDLQRMRDRKEAQVMQLRRKREREKDGRRNANDWT